MSMLEFKYVHLTQKIPVEKKSGLVDLSHLDISSKI